MDLEKFLKAKKVMFENLKIVDNLINFHKKKLEDLEYLKEDINHEIKVKDLEEEFYSVKEVDEVDID